MININRRALFNLGAGFILFFIFIMMTYSSWYTPKKVYEECYYVLGRYAKKNNIDENKIIGPLDFDMEDQPWPKLTIGGYVWDTWWSIGGLDIRINCLILVDGRVNLVIKKGQGREFLSGDTLESVVED